jgi:hypothetical protein
MTRKIADYSVDLDEGLDIYDRAEARAIQRLTDDSLMLPPEPPRQEDGSVFDGRLPANLPSLSPTEIGEYHNLMIEWHAYVSGRVTLAKTALSSAQEKLKLTKAKVRKSKSGAAKDKEDDTLLDVRFVEAQADVLELETYYMVASANEDVARKRAAFCSRIIETKKIELEQGRRSENIRSPSASAFNKNDRPRRRRQS